MPRFVEVVFPLPLNNTFTYDIGDEDVDIQVGHRVLAPFGRRTLTGYVVDLPPEAGEIDTKRIRAVLDDVPILTPTLVSLARRMAALYGSSFGEAIQTVLPPGLVRESRRRIFRTERSDPPSDSDQQAFWDRLRSKRGLDFVSTIRRNPESARIIRALEKGKWISIESVLRSERAKEKTTLLYRLTDTGSDAEALRGKKQQKVIEFLKSHGGEASLSELRRLDQDVRRILLPLERKKLITRESRIEEIDYSSEDPFLIHPKVDLTAAQHKAADRLMSALDRQQYAPFLLHGITGSGKTEIYLQVAHKALEFDRQVLALVPEISLTPQFVGRFRARFGKRIAVLHSGRSESERLTEWKRIRRGEATVVIGARSAVFAPLHRIGFIVVDEEHDSSYKQEEGLLYSAREMARFRAETENAVIVFGSATPSLEIYEASRNDEIERLDLPGRVTKHDLPHVHIVDLRKELPRFGEKGMFSAELRNALATTLSKNDQAVLFLNRRGFAPVIFCPSCGESLRCENCSVAMTYHEKESSYLCHYCGTFSPRDIECRACAKKKWIHLGVGTERVEKELRFLFPDARICRMDRDAVRSRGNLESILHGLARREIDILIGTQMVTKGLDLPHVNLVGVLLADQSLHFPDFRSAERTFQLLTQVVGRSGRGHTKGEAFIQTFQPEHYVIQTAAAQDFGRFFQKEIGYRKELNYPPFSSLALIELSSLDREQARASASWLGKQVRTANDDSTIDFLGPAPAPIAKIGGRFRFHLIVRSPRGSKAAAFSRWLVDQTRKRLAECDVAMRLDVDPYRFL